MTKSHFLESDDPDYVLVSKRVWYLNARCYASVVNSLAEQLGEHPNAIFRQTAQLAELDVSMTSDEEVNSYIKALIDMGPSNSILLG